MCAGEWRTEANAGVTRTLLGGARATAGVRVSSSPSCSTQKGFEVNPIPSNPTDVTSRGSRGRPFAAVKAALDEHGKNRDGSVSPAAATSTPPAASSPPRPESVARARLGPVLGMRLPPGLGARPRVRPRLDEELALPDRVDSRLRWPQGRRLALAERRQGPVHASADAVLGHLRDALLELGPSRECELRPDHELLALLGLWLPLEVAAVQGVGVASDLAGMRGGRSAGHAMRSGGHALLRIAASCRQGTDGRETGGQPPAALHERRAHERNVPRPRRLKPADDSRDAVMRLEPSAPSA